MIAIYCKAGSEIEEPIQLPIESCDDLAEYLEKHRGPCVKWTVGIWDTGETFTEERTVTPIAGLLNSIIRADMGWAGKSYQDIAETVAAVAGNTHVFRDYEWGLGDGRGEDNRGSA